MGLEFLQTLNLIITFSLIVLIWFIQILHYPFFEYISDERFTTSMVFHQRMISMIVIPLMLSEVVVMIALLSMNPKIQNYISCICLLGIWMSTFFLQVPLHQKLCTGKNQATIQRLVKTNWLRTILWTLKGLIFIF